VGHSAYCMSEDCELTVIGANAIREKSKSKSRVVGCIWQFLKGFLEFQFN